MKFDLRWTIFVLVVVLVVSSTVIALPPVPPLIPSNPAEAPSCSITNDGVEICDSLDNDCDGAIDEDVSCTSVPAPTTGTSSSSGSKSHGGGGSGSGSGGILFFSEPESSGTVVVESTLPVDDSDDKSSLSKDSLELLSSSAGQQTSLVSVEPEVSEEQAETGSTNVFKSAYNSIISSNYRNIFVGSFVFIIIGVIALLVVKYHSLNNISKPQSSQGVQNNSLNTAENNALTYISQMRKNNYNENQIKSLMKKSGWDDEEIDKLTKIKSK